MEVVQPIGAPSATGFRQLRLQNDGSMIRAVRTWLHEQETSWYWESMHALVSRCCKFADIGGSYVEK
jgi:hypothetical protein